MRVLTHHPVTAPPSRRRKALRALSAVLGAVAVALAPASTAVAAQLPTSGTDPSAFGLSGGLGSVGSNVAVNLDAAFGMISPTSIGSLLDSSFSLADLDPVTGALLGTDVTTAATADYAISADLSNSALMAVDQADLARRSLEQAEAARRAQAAQRAQAAAGGGQTEVGPDGCPSSVPANTMREGAANIGVAELCANSVAQAPTPQAAMAIKYQLSNLGKPYSQPKRMTSGHYDCSSLAMRSYASSGLEILVGGWAPNTTAIRSSRWAERIDPSSAKPGDLVFPFPGHVATKLSDGYMVHTNRPGDVSHVKKLYRSIYYAVRVNPDKV